MDSAAMEVAVFRRSGTVTDSSTAKTRPTRETVHSVSTMNSTVVQVYALNVRTSVTAFEIVQMDAMNVNVYG